jgi:hypothetical protein
MGRRFHELTFTPLVQQEQQKHGSREQYARADQAAKPGDAIGPQEEAFLLARDSFYMASVSEAGWPYVQHRGGAAGFLRVLSPKLLGFADLRGNKQYISLGNLRHEDRVALFLMDYPHQTRLKILGRVEAIEVGAGIGTGTGKGRGAGTEQDARIAELLPRLEFVDPETGKAATPEHILLIHVEAVDWNCPQHITPRYTLEELQPSLAVLRQQLEALEAENAALRKSAGG